jgi:hypothetical protein
MNWLDRQIAIIFDWWRKRKLMKACPELAEIAKREAEARMKHKAVRPLQKARTVRMAALLREGR